MDPRGKRVLQVGSGWFDPVSGELSLDDRSTRLRPRTSALLAHLITHSDRIIGKDELLQAVWPNVVVTEDSLVQCVKEIRRALGPERHDWIRTVPREGYAFVPVFKDAPDKPSTRVERAPWSLRHLAVAVVVIAFAVGAIVVAQLTRSDRATALPPLSVVVMPITNLTGDPARENAVDEMTERLAGSLSRFPDAFVIAPSTAFTFKGKTVDIRRVGSDLGVRYVLEGALRQQNAVLQLDLRLADSTNAVQLWSETFEVPAENPSELRHEVVALVAGSLGLRLISAEAQRSQRERNAPDAMNLVIRARAALRWSGQGEEGVEQARQLLEEAVRLEEGLAEAWALLAWTYLDEIRFRPGRDDALQRAAHAVERAISLSPDSADAHGAKARLLYNRAQMPQALLSFQRAIELNPNDPQWQSHSAATFIMLGRPEPALAAIDKAMRLSPRDPQLPLWQMFDGVALLHLGRNDEAIVRLNQAVGGNPKSAFGRLFLASALGNAGRIDEARTQIQELQRLRPGFTLTQFRSREPSNDSTFLAQRQRVYEGLRLAGLPD